MLGLPVTFNVILLVASTGDVVITNTLHKYVLFSSVVLNCEMMYELLYSNDSVSTELALIPSVRLSTTPSLLQITSTLLVMPLAVVMLHFSNSDCPTIWSLRVLTITEGTGTVV